MNPKVHFMRFCAGLSVLMFAFIFFMSLSVPLFATGGPIDSAFFVFVAAVAVYCIGLLMWIYTEFVLAMAIESGMVTIQRADPEGEWKYE